MTRVGMIINSRAARNRSIADDLLSVASRFPVLPHVIDGIDRLPQALEDMARRSIDTMILSGGDGTMQAAITETINQGHFSTAPNYVALPGGATNVIASDCGLRGGSPAMALDQFLWRWSRGETRRLSRPLIGVQLSEKQMPIYGFFLGAGDFHSAVTFTRQKIHTTGATRSLAVAMSIAGFLSRRIAGPAPDRPALSLDMRDDDGALSRQDLSLMIMTTLSRLSLGVYPFWGDGDGELSVTTMSHPQKRLWLAALPILLGRPAAWMERAGYVSWRTNELRLRLDAPFVFDGEILFPNAQEDMIISVSKRAAFLT